MSCHGAGRKRARVCRSCVDCPQEAPTRGTSRLAPVIPRYSRPEMARVWSEERKLELWLEVELAALDAWAELGVVPVDSAQRIRAEATPPTPGRVAAIERQTNHDLAAFV